MSSQDEVAHWNLKVKVMEIWGLVGKLSELGNLQAAYKAIVSYND